MSGLEKLFYSIWKMMQLTLIFHLLSSFGLILFGMGPAWHTILELFNISESHQKNYSLKEAFKIWSSHFKESNLYFLSFINCLVFLGLNLHLAIQLEGLVFFVLTFLIVVAMIGLTLTYLQSSIFLVHYEISFWDNLKLSFMSLFISFRKVIEMLGLILLILALTWQFKGLYLFLTYGLLVYGLNYVTKPTLQLVDRYGDEL
ncbi:YesL family protein [Streptococcus parauberis]|uniref:YesL family protein n=1 Tax=Streptococcus parauberis TaxID=1348 RepID=UPI0037BD891F